MNRTHVIMLALGVALGVLAFWIYTKRETLGFVVENRGKIDGFSQILEGWNKVTA